jgi:hypothetical protein
MYGKDNYNNSFYNSQSGHAHALSNILAPISPIGAISCPIAKKRNSRGGAINTSLSVFMLSCTSILLYNILLIIGIICKLKKDL